MHYVFKQKKDSLNNRDFHNLAALKDADGFRLLIILGSPAHSAVDLSSPCRRVWRRAILIKIYFEFQSVFAGANHQAGFSSWRAIGWFNTMTTGKRRQSSQLCTESIQLGPLITPLVLTKKTAASLDQRTIYD